MAFAVFALLVGLAIPLGRAGASDERPGDLRLVWCGGAGRKDAAAIIPPRVPGSGWVCDVKRGFAHNDEFLCAHENRLISGDMSSGESRELVDLGGALENNERIWQIGYANDLFIYFSVAKYDPGRTVGAALDTYNIYRFDRVLGSIASLRAEGVGSPYFSVRGGRVYYVGARGRIIELDGDVSTTLGVMGRFPSVSPDGSQLAFAAFGILNDHVYVYDFKSKEKRSVVGFFGGAVVSPIIKWSRDGAYIAVRREDDLFTGPVSVVSARGGGVAFHAPDLAICNWFFSEKNTVNGTVR